MPIKDKEKRNAYLRVWCAANKEKVLQYGYTYSEKHPIKKLLKSSKCNAKSKGLEYNIVEDDINIPTHCPYLGIELTSKVEKRIHLLQCRLIALTVQKDM